MSIKLYLNLDPEFAGFCQTELTYYFKTVFETTVEFTSEDETANILLDVTPQLDTQRNDQLDIVLVDGKGHLKSNTQIGLLIGIYRFFESFGVSYLRPGRINEKIAKQSIATFFEKEISINEEASFQHRGVCIEGADSFENVKDFIDWLPKVGFNTFFIQFENPYSFFKRWYDHEFNPYLEKELFTNEIAQEMSDLIDQEMSVRGIVHHRVGHGWTGEVLGYSSKFGWESGLTITEDKKPLVAELNGERELFKTAPILTSLDFSNPDVSPKMVKSIVDYAKTHQEVDYLHVWLSDAHNNICECQACQDALPSDQYVRILNDLDKELMKEGLETKICFLLYHELLFAPSKEILVNPERFTLMFAPISRTFEKSYADVNYQSDIPEPKAYQRNKIALPNSLEENLAYLFSWQAMFKGDSFVYDYPLGRAHYGDLGYMKISHVIYHDIKFLNNLTLNGYISCQELRAGFPHNFPNYVMGKMLWDNQLSYDELKAEYFAAMYGNEWQTVTTYLEQLSTHSSCDYFNAIGDRLNPELAASYQIARNLANEFLPVLEANTQLSEGVSKAQWLQLGFHREFVLKLSKALELLCLGKNAEGQLAWRDFLDFIRRNEHAIQPDLDVYRIIEVAKNYAGFIL